MENKEKIIELYYISHLKVCEIELLLNVSSAYISKIIKNDSRYCEEKIHRKELSHEKRKSSQRKFIKEKREIQRYADNYNFVQAQHIQASKELSKGKHLSNEAYRKWNSSAYKYNPSKKRYEFNNELGRSYDVPKYIKER